jgi:hypothetical protein
MTLVAPPVPSAHRVLVHATDAIPVLRRLAQPGLESKVSMALRQMFETGRPNGRSKSTAGANKGWLRLPLAGTGGSHFYLYWAPAHPDREIRDALGAPAVVVRAVLHHDSTSAALSDDPASLFSALELSESKGIDGLDSPFTAAQDRFAVSRDPVRYFQGAAGGGKTQALWRAVERGGAVRTIYLTWSPMLAADARRHFSLVGADQQTAFLPVGASFQAVDLRSWWAKRAGFDAELVTLRASREAFIRALHAAKVPPRALGPWKDRSVDLFAELRAQLFGAADLLEETGLPRQTDYVARRVLAGLDADAAETAFGIARQLLASIPETSPHHPARWLPEIFLARRLVLQPVAPPLEAVDRLVVDEIQDLTPIELRALLETVCAAERSDLRPVELLLAGDEAQTVRPTGFRHASLKDMIVEKLNQRVQETVVEVNLRCPASVVDVLDRIRDLYKELPKQTRPAGSRTVDAVLGSEADLVLALVADGAEARELLHAMSDSGNVQTIMLQETCPDWLEGRAEERLVMTPEFAKGLEFPVAVVLGAGELVSRVRSGLLTEAHVPWLRTQLDRLTVAVSRTNGALIFAELGAPDAPNVRFARELLFEGNNPCSNMTLPEIVEYLRDGKETAAERVNRLYRNGLAGAQEQPEFALLQVRMAARELTRSEEFDSFAPGERAAASEQLSSLILRLLLGDDLEPAQRKVALETLDGLAPMAATDLALELSDAVRACAVCLQHSGLRGLDHRFRADLLLSIIRIPPTALREDLSDLLSVWRKGLLESLLRAVGQPELAARLGPELPRILALFGEPAGEPHGELVSAAVASLFEAKVLSVAERTLDAWPAPEPELWIELYRRQERWDRVAALHVDAGRAADATDAFRRAGRTGEALVHASEPAVRELLVRWQELVSWLRREQQALVPFERSELLDAFAGENLAAELRGKATLFAEERRQFEQATAVLAERERVTSRLERVLDARGRETADAIRRLREEEAQVHAAAATWRLRHAELAARESELLGREGVKAESEALRALLARRQQERDEAQFEAEHLKEQLELESERIRVGGAERDRLRGQLERLREELQASDSARALLAKQARKQERRISELGEEKQRLEASLAEMRTRTQEEQFLLDGASALREQLERATERGASERAKRLDAERSLDTERNRVRQLERELRDARQAGAALQAGRVLTEAGNVGSPSDLAEVRVSAASHEPDAEPMPLTLPLPTITEPPSMRPPSPASEEVALPATPTHAFNGAQPPVQPPPSLEEPVATAPRRARFQTIVRQAPPMPEAAPAGATDEAAATRPADAAASLAPTVSAVIPSPASPAIVSPEMRARLRTIESACRLIEAFASVPAIGVEAVYRRLLMMEQVCHARLLGVCRAPAQSWDVDASRFGPTAKGLQDGLGLRPVDAEALLILAAGSKYGPNQRLPDAVLRAALELFGSMVTLVEYDANEVRKMAESIPHLPQPAPSPPGLPPVPRLIRPLSQSELDAYRSPKALPAARPYSLTGALVGNIGSNFHLSNAVTFAIVERVAGPERCDSHQRLTLDEYAAFCEFVAKIPVAPPSAPAQVQTASVPPVLPPPKLLNAEPERSLRRPPYATGAATVRNLSAHYGISQANIFTVILRVTGRPLSELSDVLTEAEYEQFCDYASGRKSAG